MTLNTLLFLGGIGVQKLALLFIIFGIWIWALIDLLTSNFESGITKIIWLLVILFIPVLGPLAYLGFPDFCYLRSRSSFSAYETVALPAFGLLIVM